MGIFTSIRTLLEQRKTKTTTFPGPGTLYYHKDKWGNKTEFGSLEEMLLFHKLNKKLDEED